MVRTFNYAINDGFQCSEVIIKGEKKYYIEGYASTIDPDKAGEIIDTSAQEDLHRQMQNENITMDIEHEEWYSTEGKLLPRPKNEKIPVAKIVDAILKPRGVWVKAELNTNLRSFQELWGSIKDGFLKAFSVAFYPIQKSGGVIKHLNLVNVTLTGSPVNPQATFAISMKSASAWLDSQEQLLEDGVDGLKAEKKPKVDTPETPGVEAPKEEAPKHPKMTEVKAEDKEYECKKCDKEFKSQEALDEHKKSCSATVKAEDKMTEEIKTEPVAEVKAEAPAVVAEPVFDVQAELKAMKEKHEAELKALHENIANLKAELAKPVMKSLAPTEMPEDKPVMQKVQPLQLVR